MNDDFKQDKMYVYTEKTLQKLRDKGLKLALAESCTGGVIASTITEIAGSSDVFDRGYVTYSNQSKMDLLNVSEKTLEEHGAVSGQTALEMAQGALKNANLNSASADIAISVTGIAGPSGGTDEKPVGLVFIAFVFTEDASKKLHKKNNVLQLNLEGSRWQIRRAVTNIVIAELSNILSGF